MCKKMVPTTNARPWAVFCFPEWGYDIISSDSIDKMQQEAGARLFLGVGRLLPVWCRVVRDVADFSFIVLRERPRHSCRGGIARHAKRAPSSRILRLAGYLYKDQV